MVCPVRSPNIKFENQCASRGAWDESTPDDEGPFHADKPRMLIFLPDAEPITLLSGLDHPEAEPSFSSTSRPLPHGHQRFQQHLEFVLTHLGYEYEAGGSLRSSWCTRWWPTPRGAGAGARSV